MKKSRYSHKHFLPPVFLLFVLLLVLHLHSGFLAYADMGTSVDNLGIFAADSTTYNTNATAYGSLKPVAQLTSNPNQVWTSANGPVTSPRLQVPVQPGAYEMRLAVNNTTQTYTFADPLGTIGGTGNCDGSYCYGTSETFWSVNGAGGLLDLSALTLPCTVNSGVYYPAIQLTWGTLVGVGTINVYRSQNGGVYQLIAQVSGSSSSFVDQKGADFSPPGDLTPGQPYSYFITAIAANNSGSSMNSVVTSSLRASYCTITNPLNMNNVQPVTGFTGKYGASGTNGGTGKSWLNPINLNPLPSAGAGDIAFYALAIYDNAINKISSITNLTDIESKIGSQDSENNLGFILAYQNKTGGHLCQNSSTAPLNSQCLVDDTGFNFSTSTQGGMYFVYFNGAWKDISSYSIRNITGNGYAVIDSTGKTIFWILIGNPAVAGEQQPNWQVQFNNGFFRNRTMYTASYIMDDVDSSTYQSDCNINTTTSTVQTTICSYP